MPLLSHFSTATVAIARAVTTSCRTFRDRCLVLVWQDVFVVLVGVAAALNVLRGAYPKP